MAGRPRTPTNVLKLRGAEKNHPERLKERENEPVNTNPIGKPQAWLNADERKVWRTLVKESIEGVLGEADRMLLATAAQLGAKIMSGKITTPERNQWLRCLGMMGFAPTERSKINLPGQKSTNEFDDD